MFGDVSGYVCVCVCVCVCVSMLERVRTRERHDSWHLYRMYRIVLSECNITPCIQKIFSIPACQVRTRICLPLYLSFCLPVSLPYSGDTSPVDTSERWRLSPVSTWSSLTLFKWRKSSLFPALGRQTTKTAGIRKVWKSVLIMKSRHTARGKVSSTQVKKYVLQYLVNSIRLLMWQEESRGENAGLDMFVMFVGWHHGCISRWCVLDQQVGL